eukprot:evm.model.scf_677.1 EVM.evm.TU.scf_677.1   scf_677:20722-22607(+)
MLLHAAFLSRTLAEDANQEADSDDAWTLVEEKIFEAAFAVYRNHPNRWDEIARMLPLRGASACERHHRSLQAADDQDGQEGIIAASLPSTESP